MQHSIHSKSANTSRREILWVVAFFSVATIIAVLVGAHFEDEGMNRLPALLYGAVVGAVGPWFLLWGSWQIAMRVTRGAPFRIGYPVEITSGEQKGTRGIVSEVFEYRYDVRVILETQTDTESSAIFNWNELRRVSTK
ncbi:MAG: hypothetical protein M3Y56_02250 [Armatimonadota bacterium]|nr:hypothetical protein [Armatimonadota bacterium]